MAQTPRLGLALLAAAQAQKHVTHNEALASLDGLVQEVGRAWDLGIRCVVLFPKVADGLKTEDGAECFNEGGLIPRAIRRLKEVHPEMAIMTDVALDPYSCDGHDGIVSDDHVRNCGSGSDVHDEPDPDHMDDNAHVCDVCNSRVERGPDGCSAGWNLRHSLRWSGKWQLHDLVCKWIAFGGSGGIDRNREFVNHHLRGSHSRSEERRVGKECRSRWSPYH